MICQYPVRRVQTIPVIFAKFPLVSRHIAAILPHYSIRHIYPIFRTNLLDGLQQIREIISVIVANFPLKDGSQTLKTHSRIYVFLRKNVNRVIIFAIMAKLTQNWGKIDKITGYIG